MKNWEFYEKELKRYNLGFAMKGNQIYNCAKVSCCECDFDMGESCICDTAKVRWLYQEHKEPIVLTEDEKALCKLLGRGWIARDNDDNLYWYEIKPKKKNFSAWLASSRMCIGIVFSQCKFNFIKWEDEEPWEVKVND